jgi:lysophospholipase L1-like esterase
MTIDASGRILMVVAVVAGLTAIPASASAATVHQNLAAAFDNAGISAAAAPETADIDGSGHSFVAENLVAAGWRPGAAVTLNGTKLRFPATAPGTPDNVVADGQVISARGSGSALTFLVTSTGSATGGQGSIAYADGSTQSYALAAPDWFYGPTSSMVLATPQWNTPDGPRSFSGKLYAVSVPLEPSRRVTEVTLPTVTGDADLHVFAMGFRPASDGWAGTWSTAIGESLTPWPWTNRTMRMVEHSSIGGKQARIRLDNAFGPAPLTVGRATIAVQKSGSTPVAAPVTLTFGGRRAVTMPAGGQAISDSLPFEVPADSNLLVSLYLPGTVIFAPMHGLGMQDMYSSAEGAGDHTAATTFPVGDVFGFWAVLSGIDVVSDDRAGSVVALGDSITDGTGSGQNTNSRWPDFLARRLLAGPGPVPGVVNAGISGNRILSDSFTGRPNSGGAGVSALARLDRDVLSRSGVRTLIVLEGINDISNTASSSADVIAGLRQIADRARAAHIRVIVGTLTPLGNCSCSNPTLEAARRQVNDFIRNNGGAFDGFVDFDAAIRDPADPMVMLPAHDSGDHLHPSAAGYRAMADAIDLGQLR